MPPQPAHRTFEDARWRTLAAVVGMWQERLSTGNGSTGQSHAIVGLMLTTLERH